MRKVILFFVMASLAFGLFQPCFVFGKGKDDVKISELLKDANTIMSEAQETYIKGDSSKAVDLYKKALVEIIKIERQYPDRVTSSDFAPLRFRRALCETEIDRLLIEKVNVASRTVAVTDTRELERKRAERKANAETNRFAKVSKKLTSKTSAGAVNTPVAEPVKPKADEKKEAKPVQKPVNVEVEIDWARDMIEAGKFDEAEKSVIKALRAAPDNFNARYMLALVFMKQGKLQEALIIVDDLVADYSRNEGVLLLSAGLFASVQQYAKAMTALDKALKIAPDRPEGYFNMAWLLLEMNPKELSDPEMYYRRAVELGGARDSELEKRLGIRPN